MIYSGSEEESNLDNINETTEVFGSEENSIKKPSLTFEPVPTSSPTPPFSPLLTAEEYQKLKTTYIPQQSWWTGMPEDEVKKINQENESEYRRQKYIREISEATKKQLETRGLTNLIDTPITRSVQSGIDSLVGGSAQFLGSAYDLAARNNKENILTQWGAETSMKSNYMSNYVQREKGDTNQWDDVTGAGSFLTWGLHTAAHMAPSFVPYLGWAGKGLSWAGKGVMGLRALKAATGVADAAALTKGVRIAGTLSTTMHEVVGATAKEKAASMVQKGFLSRVTGSLSKGINPEKTIGAINIATDSSRKISMLSRLASQTPVAFNFGVSGYGQIRPELVNQGMDYDEATYKAFASALPQAAFAYLPAFGKLNPSFFRFMGEAATMGGVNVLMNPVQAMVDESLSLDEPKEGETYWDYIYRKSTENVMEPFAIGALFHLMSLPGRKFGRLAKLDRDYKKMESELLETEASGTEEGVAAKGEPTYREQPTLSMDTDVLRDADGNITGRIVRRSSDAEEGGTYSEDGTLYPDLEDGPTPDARTEEGNVIDAEVVPSVEEVHSRNIFLDGDTPVEVVITDPYSGVTESARVIPSTKSFDETNGSTIRTDDGRVIKTENITHKTSPEKQLKFNEELDKLKGIKKELLSRVVEDNNVNAKFNAGVKSEIVKIERAIKALELHRSLHDSFNVSNDKALESIFGENFSPTVHGQQILFQYQSALHDLLLLRRWMEGKNEDGTLLSLSEQLPAEYLRLNENIDYLTNELRKKYSTNQEIYAKIEELYEILGQTDPTKSLKIYDIKTEIDKLYKELKKDYEHPNNIGEFTEVVNVLKQIATIDNFSQDLVERTNEFITGRMVGDATQSTNIVNEISIGGIKYNKDFGSKDTSYNLEVNRLSIAETEAKPIKNRLSALEAERSNLITIFDKDKKQNRKLRRSDVTPEELENRKLRLKDIKIEENSLKEKLKVIYKKVSISNSFLDGQTGEPSNETGVQGRAETTTAETKYDTNEPAEGGLRLVSKNNKFGYINQKGEVVVPIKYVMGKALKQKYSLALDAIEIDASSRKEQEQARKGKPKERPEKSSFVKTEGSKNVYVENKSQKDLDAWGTEAGKPYINESKKMDVPSYDVLANPVYDIVLGLDKPEITLKKLENGEVLATNLTKEFGKDFKRKDIVQKTITIDEVSYFVRNIDANNNVHLIELSGNNALDSNVVRIEQTINRLNFYYQSRFNKKIATVKNKKTQESEQRTLGSIYSENLLSGSDKFVRYLIKQVDTGLMSLDEASKVYKRLNYVKKSFADDFYLKEKRSETKSNQERKASIESNKTIAPETEANSIVFDKDGLNDQYKKSFETLSALIKLGKEKNPDSDFVKQLIEFNKLFKNANLKIGTSENQRLLIKNYKNLVDNVRKIKEIYESDKFTVLRDNLTKAQVTELSDYFNNTLKSYNEFSKNNAELGSTTYADTTSTILEALKSKKQQLIAKLDAFKDIIDIATKDTKKLKSRKEVDDFFANRLSAKKKDALRLDMKPTKNRIPRSLTNDTINNALSSKDFSFDSLSSTIVNIGGQDVYLKTALIQNSTSRKVSKVGDVFVVNKRFYVVKSIEKLPDLNFDTVTDNEVASRAKFEKTGFDLKKVSETDNVVKKTYFDENGKFKDNFELVTYELVEGRANRVSKGIDGKPNLIDAGLQNEFRANDYLNISNHLDNFDEVMDSVRGSVTRVNVDETISSGLSGFESGRERQTGDSRLGQYGYGNDRTIGNTPPEATKPTPSQEATKPTSSMFTDPTAHTANQAKKKQESLSQEQAPRQVTEEAPQQVSPETNRMSGSEEGPARESNPTITNETSQVFNDGKPTDSPMPQRRETQRIPTNNERVPQPDKSNNSRRVVPPDEVDNSGPPKRPPKGPNDSSSFGEESSRRSRMLDEAEASKEKFTLWEKFKNWWVSDDSPLEKLVTTLQTKLGKKLPDSVNAFLQFSLANQRKNAAINKTKFRFDGEIMEPMKKAFGQYYKTRQKTMDKKQAVKQFMVDFDLFVELRSAPDLNAAFAEWAAMEPGKVKNLTPPRTIDKANSMIQDLSRKEPELYRQFTDMHDKLTNILNDSLKELVTAGILDTKTYNKLVAKYKYYAPMYAYEDALNSPTHLSKYNVYNERGGIGFSGLDIALKNRLGNSDVPRGDVLQHSLQMLKKRARAVAYAPAQESLYKFVKLGLENGIFKKNFVSIIDPENSGTTVDSLVEGGMSYSDALLLAEGFKNNIIKKTYVDAKGNLVVKEISVPPPADNIVPLQIFNSLGESKKIYLAFDSKNEIAMHMAKLYNGSLDKGWMPTGVVGKSYFKVLKVWNALNTGYNPFFAIKNFSADYFDMLTNITNTPIAGKKWQITKEIPKSIKMIGKYNLLQNKFKKDGNHIAFDAAVNADPLMRSYHEYYMNGGSHNFVEDNNLVINEITDNLSSQLRKGTGYQGGRNILEGIGNLVSIEMNALENSIRFASYTEGRKMGMSLDQATLLGKDITANFDRKGLISRKINGVYSYTTANIAGQSRVFKSLTGKKGLVLLSGAILAGMAQQSMYDEMDGLESAAIPDYVKRQYMIFPSSDGGYFKIRIRGLGMLFQLGRNISKLSNGDTSSLTLTKDILNSFSFTGSGGGAEGVFQNILPTLLKPLAAIATNESWTGSKIRNEDPQGLTPKWMLARAGSNPVADNVARALYEATEGQMDLSPQDFEYFFKVYSGGAVTQSVQFAKSISEIGDETVYKPTANPFISPLPYGQSDIKGGAASYIYELDEKMRSTNQIIKKFIEAGDTGNANRLIANARIPYNNSELMGLSRKRSRITEEKNRFVRLSRINGSINSPEFKEKLNVFNKQQDEIVAKQAEAFKKYGVIK